MPDRSQRLMHGESVLSLCYLFLVRLGGLGNEYGQKALYLGGFCRVDFKMSDLGLRKSDIRGKLILLKSQLP